MTRVADRKLKNRMFTNIVMIGAVTEFTGLVSREAMREAVKNIVPRATIEKNLAALEAGFTLAEETMEGRTPAAKGGAAGIVDKNG